MNENINRVSEAFYTFNAPLSRRLCQDLDAMGPMGQLASLLFKAGKASKQARSYQGKAPVSRRPYCDYSKDRMKEMLMKAVCLLDAHAKPLGISWGWRANDKPDSPPWVLSIDLPNGQVTYGLPDRLMGPDYESASESDFYNSIRITELCADVLDGRWMVMNGRWMGTDEEIWE